MVDPDDGTTTYLYDAAGRQNRITDPRDKTTTLAFDRANRQTSKLLPNGAERHCKYDAAGNKIAVYTTRPDSVETSISIEPIRDGVAVADFAEGIGYFMYSEESVHTRFSGYLGNHSDCLLYTSPSPRDLSTSRMPSSA